MPQEGNRIKKKAAFTTILVPQQYGPSPNAIRRSRTPVYFIYQDGSIVRPIKNTLYASHEGVGIWPLAFLQTDDVCRLRSAVSFNHIERHFFVFF